VAYNAATHTVSLVTQTRINIHYRYQLIVEGVRSGGIASTLGHLLDGKGKGVPGSNYHAPITWRNLVLEPRAATKSRRPKASLGVAQHQKASETHHSHQKHGLFTRSKSFRR
jgi:hypothetical protein